jgi:Tol biopolymer transport system component
VGFDAVHRLNSLLSDRYRVERELGAGGMATVYLAHDVRHDRAVAVKVLRPDVASALGAARFLAEIRTTAALQHPHLLPLLDSGEISDRSDSEGGRLLFYVMPYVSGESLRNRLDRERLLPVADAVRIAAEVADALDYAHRHGVVHRDIKPANILLPGYRAVGPTAGGWHALVADFGVALAASRADERRLTATGISVGTPQYMSPEQAMGDASVDARADIYSLGAVLYEMLAGEPPFTGPSAQAIVAKVLTEKAPALELRRDTVPPHVSATVARALAKLPADRFASAREFSDAVLGALPLPPLPARNVDGPDREPVQTSGALPPRRPTTAGAGPRRWIVAGSLITAVGALAAWWALNSREPAPIPVVRFEVRSPSVLDGDGVPFALSPDGSRLVYVARDSSGSTTLLLRDLGVEQPTPLAGTRGAAQPFFSPDGQWIGFIQGSTLRKVPVSGGAAITICDLDGPLYGASWGPNDAIVFSAQDRLWRVPATGGTAPVALTPVPASERDRWPELLPDGRTVLFTRMRGTAGGGVTVGALSIDDGSVRDVSPIGLNPHYVQPGYLAYTQSITGTTVAVPFDPQRVIVTGAPRPIAERVRVGGAAVAKIAVARSGAFVYIADLAGGLELAIVDREGRDVGPAAPRDFYSHPRFSPDGRRVAVTRNRATPVTGDIWIYDLGSHAFERLTSDTLSIVAEWTPDGHHLVYTSGSSSRRGITLNRISADGSGRLDTLLAHRRAGIAQLTPDGRTMIFLEVDAAGRGDIWITPLDNAAAAQPLVHTAFNETSPALSPDGQWLAYVSDETGRNEVYVRRLRTEVGRRPFSTNGGTEPRWTKGGHELFYRKGDSVFIVAVPPGAAPSAAMPRLAFVMPIARLLGGAYDVSPDGQRLVVAREQPGPRADPLHVVLGGFAQPVH